MARRDLTLFIGQLLKRPHQVVAVAPSSRALCAEMVAGLDPAAGPVIELGAGTGHVTRAILNAGIPPEQCHSIELNPVFCDHLGDRFPGLSIHRASAGDLADLPVENAQAVLSGLPLLSMPVSLQRAILAGFIARARAGGSYVQFTYGPKPPVARIVRQDLSLEWHRSRLILGNLPPARVYRFRPARSAACAN